MLTRKPMKRTGFKSQKAPEKSQQDREQRLMQRAQAAIKIVATRAAVIAPVSSAPAPAVLKAKPWRSEAYRRAVASLPCICCGVHGYSQAAHANTGKGAGTKTHDYMTFPLCCDRPGVRGCHSRFDQGAMFDKQARQLIEPAWWSDTRRRLLAMGLVDEKDLPQE